MNSKIKSQHFHITNQIMYSVSMVLHITNQIKYSVSMVLLKLYAPRLYFKKILLDKDLVRFPLFLFHRHSNNKQLHPFILCSSIKLCSSCVHIVFILCSSIKLYSVNFPKEPDLQIELDLIAEFVMC